MDAEGYLTLTGRIKELINRGGEKISPLEVRHVYPIHPLSCTAFLGSRLRGKWTLPPSHWTCALPLPHLKPPFSLLILFPLNV